MTQNTRRLNLTVCVWAALTKQVEANWRLLQNVTQAAFKSATQALRQGNMFFAGQECVEESGWQRGSQTHSWAAPKAYSSTWTLARPCCASETTSGGGSEPQRKCQLPPHLKLSHRGRCGELAHDSHTDRAVWMELLILYHCSVELTETSVFIICDKYSEVKRGQTHERRKPQQWIWFNVNFNPQITAQQAERTAWGRGRLQSHYWVCYRTVCYILLCVDICGFPVVSRQEGRTGRHWWSFVVWSVRLLLDVIKPTETHKVRFQEVVMATRSCECLNDTGGDSRHHKHSACWDVSIKCTQSVQWHNTGCVQAHKKTPFLNKC